MLQLQRTKTSLEITGEKWIKWKLFSLLKINAWHAQVEPQSPVHSNTTYRILPINKLQQTSWIIPLNVVHLWLIIVIAHRLLWSA